MSAVTVRQMIAADILKLRRQRPLMAFVGLLSVGVIVLFLAYAEIRHLGDPRLYGAAGGMHTFDRVLESLALYFGALAAMLVGAEAGSADQSSGVFRDLVVTGRGRLSLFAVRLPAAVAVTLAFSAIGYLVGLAGTFLLASASQATPSLSLVLQGAGWIAVANIVLVALAVGTGSLTSSRAITLTAVIGWQMVATQIILGVSSLGFVRKLVLDSPLGQLAPVRNHVGVTMSTGLAVVVLIAWAVVPALVGAWRTRTVDA